MRKTYVIIGNERITRPLHRYRMDERRKEQKSRVANTAIKSTGKKYPYDSAKRQRKPA